MQSELARSILIILKAGGQIQYGNGSIVADGIFAKAILIEPGETSRDVKETTFPLTSNGVLELLEALDWKG
jgi:hypothetical protein